MTSTMFHPVRGGDFDALEDESSSDLRAGYGDSLNTAAAARHRDSNSSNSSSNSINDTAQNSSRNSHRNQTFQRRWAVTLFSIITILLFADQNLMAPNLTAIANDFGFDEQERDKKLGGDIALGFWVLGAPASFIIGCMADTYNRSILFAVTAGLGEGACLATYFAQTYTQLYISRALTGFALGGAFPLIYSILGDLYPADQRHAVSAIVSIGSGLGIMIGQGVAGFVGPTLGWRAPFAIIGAPALFCALVVFLTVQDPERGAMEEAVRNHHMRHGEEDDDDDPSPSSLCASIEMKPLRGEESSTRTSAAAAASSSTIADSSLRSRRSDGSLSDEDGIVGVTIDDDTRSDRHDFRTYWATFISLLSNPTAILSFLQGAPGCVPWGIVNTYLNDFLAQDRGMSVEYATSVIFVFSGGAFVGMVVGGAGGSYLYRLDPRYPPLLAGTAAIAACFPFWVLLNSVNSESPKVFVALVAGSAGFGCTITGPIVKATISNVTMPQARGQAFAILNLFDDFGRGLGPVFLAQLIVHLGGRTPAFNVGVLGWILCGILNLLIFFTVVPDERKVQARIRADLCRKEERRLDDDDGSERRELT